MTTLDATALAQAEEFLRLNARLIDRRRFALHFRDGSPDALLAALRPYANPDGGYGHALEPDLRGEDSQTVPTQHALETLHEAGADDDPAVQRACDFLASVARPDGGVPFVLPTVRDAPHAPWWGTEDDAPPSSINPTASLAGLLHRAGARHPWLDRATDYCWNHLESADTQLGPYDVLAVLAFLEHVPDRDRAQAALTRLRDALLAPVTLDLHAPGHQHYPLDLAPTPDCLARRLFDDDVIDRHLDALAAARLPDGGWTVDFAFWTPITEPEWRGYATVQNLLILQAYGRIKE
ncbi:hypothetical protein [Actinomadura hibisca]|uniref:hypothetical protein n=1 Tax=Actinomadura hibisca TaxID=68565 RepID=UPI00082F8E66|nr:hypothetical protein [Actinomadura hibisca]